MIKHCQHVRWRRAGSEMNYFWRREDDILYERSNADAPCSIFHGQAKAGGNVRISLDRHRKDERRHENLSTRSHPRRRNWARGYSREYPDPDRSCLSTWWISV